MGPRTDRSRSEAKRGRAASRVEEEGAGRGDETGQRTGPAEAEASRGRRGRTRSRNKAEKHGRSKRRDWAANGSRRIRNEPRKTGAGRQDEPRKTRPKRRAEMRPTSETGSEASFSMHRSCGESRFVRWERAPCEKATHDACGRRPIRIAARMPLLAHTP